MSRHKVMTQLLVMAVACNQTRVFNMALTNSGSEVHMKGDPNSHHIYTHEETVDATLGYQRTTTIFVERNMQALAYFIDALATIKEGDGSLLDHCLLFAHSDTSYAKTHSVIGIPVILAGKAGGKMKTGIHVAGNGDPVSRIGLTCLRGGVCLSGDPQRRPRAEKL
jgi:hypothetical protein